MTTLAELNSQARYLLGDIDVAEYFDDFTLTEFINRAIGDLNAYFPRRILYTLAAADGQHTYELESSHGSIYSVEYPAGETPPKYLVRRSCTDAAFWDKDIYYDCISTADADSDNAPRLVISAEPAASETITLELAAEHSSLSSPTDTTSVPDRWLHLIGLFVRWKAWEYIATKEGMDPNPLKALASTQQLNATRAEAAYRTALASAQAAYTESAVTTWAYPGNRRIY